MRWEKIGDWDELTQPLSRLSIPCERTYRRWEAFRYGRSLISMGRIGLESFLVDAFIRLKELEQSRAVEEKIYTTSLVLLVAQAFPKVALTQDIVDRLMALFYKWHRTVDPGAPRPNATAADELLQQMDAFRGLFENQAGISVMAADPLGMRKQYGGGFGLPEE